MRIFKKILAIVGWVLLGLVGLILLVLLAIQTAPVKKQIVRIAENQVNNLLDATLSVGKLTGNFFTHLQLHDVLLTTPQQDTLAFIPALELAYNLPPLLKGEIMVRKVTIQEPYVHLEQLPDSTWNLQHIMKPTPDKPKDTTSSSFNMFVELGQLALNNGNIRINAFDSIIPHQLRELFLDISGHYSTKDQKVDLKTFRFVSVQPGVELKNLTVQATGNEEVIDLAELLLETAQNSLHIKGLYAFDRKKKSNVVLGSAPIVLDEFRAFLPENFHLQAQPAIHLDAELEDKRLGMELHVKDNEQGLDVQLLSYYLVEFLSDSAAPVTYDMELNIDKVDLRYWLADPNLKYIIDGILTAKGEGLDPKTLAAHVNGNFGDIVVYDNPVSRLDLTLDYNAGNINGEIKGNGNFGSLYVKPDVKDLLGERPVYQLLLRTRSLNIAPIMGPDYKTNVNLDAEVTGSGLDLDRLNAQAQLALMPSEVMGIPIDTVGARVGFARRNLTVDDLLAKALSAEVHAQGNYNLQGSSDLTLHVKADSVRKAAIMAGIEDVETSVDMKAHLYGQPDDLQADVNLHIGNTRYQELRLDSANAVVHGRLLGKEITVEADLDARRFSAGNFLLDTIQLKAQTDTKNISLNLKVGSEDIKTRLEGLVQLGEVINIALSDLWLAYKGYDWQLAQDTAYASIGATEYEVRDFNLVASGSDSTQSILAEGIISRTGNQDFRLDISNLDVGELIEVFSPGQDLNGFLNFQAQLQGTAVSPTLDGNFYMEQLKFKEFLFEKFSADLGYRNGEATVTADVIPLDSGSLYLEGRLPMGIRLDSMQFDVVPKNTDPVALQLNIKELPLSIINLVFPVDEARGYLQSDISLDGTLEKPNLQGDIDIVDGKLLLKQYGIDYRTIEVAINFGTENLSVDTFLIVSRQGDMKINGDATFGTPFYEGKLADSDIKIVFDKFNPIDHKYYNMQLSGDIDISANQDSVVFGGGIEIPQAEIYLPAVMTLLGRNVAEIPKPLLVLALEEDRISADSTAYISATDTATQENKLAFLDNLQGTLTVQIPRNTWIKHDDMRFELSGDVELVKHREFFEIFGTVDIVRGQLGLLGKVFVIETGTITFQGGEEMNPLFNIEAVYSFRDTERNKHDLTVHVTGDVNKPVIAFELEGTPINEGDALSYILFGVPMDALGSGQQQDLNAMDLASMLAASLISSQLTKILGNTFNVDYIEVNSNSFDNASFTVGKYITNKLFVSYQQTIGHIEEDDVARYEMTLEYELFKFLFLQLTSSSISNGGDVIFKFNSKTDNQ